MPVEGGHQDLPGRTGGGWRTGRRSPPGETQHSRSRRMRRYQNFSILKQSLSHLSLRLYTVNIDLEDFSCLTYMLRLRLRLRLRMLRITSCIVLSVESPGSCEAVR